MRLKQRCISRKEIVSSTANYEFIEEYPDDNVPSYLIYSRYKDIVFHILFAVDVEGDNVRVVTAYYPAHEEWQSNFLEVLGHPVNRLKCFCETSKNWLVQQLKPLFLPSK